MTEDAITKINHAKTVLEMIAQDLTIPKNIRRAAKNAMDSLASEKNTAAMRAYGAIRGLEEVSQDLNCPLHARTKIWQVVSLLETITD